LQQKNISFAEYNVGHCPSSLTDVIGKSNEPAPFTVSAILLKKNGVLYIPCPAHWFVETTGAVREKVLRGQMPAQKATETLGLHSSAGVNLPLVVTAAEATPLAGRWLRLDRLTATDIKADDLFAISDLYDTESRTGIAIDEKRKVKDGALYSAGHLRLRPDVALVIGIDRDLGLAKTGLLHLGGEQRVCGYAAIPTPDLPTTPAALYLSLAPLKLDASVWAKIFAAAKPVMLAGWDMHHRFHKPTTTWLPAGAVLTTNINNHCLPLPQ